MSNRIIKESIRTSRSINGLSDFNFRVMFYLVTYVDDFGRGSGDPELLKGQVFPRMVNLQKKRIEKALQDLHDAGIIELYEVNGEKYFYFINWTKHQTPRAKNSKFPAPAFTCTHLQANESNCTHLHGINENVNENENENENIIKKRKYEGRNEATVGLNSAEQRERLKQALLNMEG